VGTSSRKREMDALKKENRIESDFLGKREISADVYYGIQTLRASENFRITNIPISREPKMVCALGYVKKAAALANMEIGILDSKIGNAIVSACNEVIKGKLDKHFIVDALQGGAGTSTNMNANEVITNKALEIMGYEKGRYDVIHPNDHVNFSQSTNDVYPTALRIALLTLIPELMGSLGSLSQKFKEKAHQFRSVLKMGRTQLQDAVPMTLGQEFNAFATTISEDIDRLANTMSLFHEINIGATAIGSGVNAPNEYRQVVLNRLKEISGLPLKSSTDLFEATWDTGAYVQLSGVLRRVAIKLSKICNDLRLLSSGPRTGFAEINLPKTQPGSSIMPGKVNPVIPEVVNQIAFR
jgi:aspartate ammonia-lyase